MFTLLDLNMPCLQMKFEGYFGLSALNSHCQQDILCILGKSHCEEVWDAQHERSFMTAHAHVLTDRDLYPRSYRYGVLEQAAD